MFESLLVTAAYKASGVVEAFNLTSQSFHFALNQNTNVGMMTDYLNWLVALDLITASDKQQLLGSFHEPRFLDLPAPDSLDGRSMPLDVFR